MPDEPDDEGNDWGLVMPFVVCEDNGGPLNAHAFICGIYYGTIDAALSMGATWEGYVPSDLVPQLDLLAMHKGYTLTAKPWDEHPEQQTMVVLDHRAPAGASDDPDEPAS